MSVDSRLTEALERSAADFVPGAGGGLEVIVTAARRRRAKRRLMGGAAVALALVVGMGAVMDGQTRGAARPLVPAASPSTNQSPTPVGQAEADRQMTADLMGTWTTGVVSPRTASAAMVRTGTAAYRDSVLHVLHLPGTITLTFENLAYRAQLDGEPVDEGTWSVRDGKLVLVPYCAISCRMEFGPSLHDGVLRLTLLKDTSPAVDRVPSSAHSSVIYGSAPFHRS